MLGLGLGLGKADELRGMTPDCQSRLPIFRKPGPHWVLSVGAAAACMLLTGCVTDGGAADQPKSTLAEGRVLRVAGGVQRTEPGRTLIDGGGESMAPVMGENTVVVVQPIAYADLQPEMIVAYRNRRGVQIIHQLVRREPDGWVARGWNNANIDPEKVTPENLLGVVYAFFHTAETAGAP